MLRLGDNTSDPAPAKAATLHRLRRAGLPVPPGFVIPLDLAALDRPEVAAALADLLTAGPAIVRSALADEDAEAASRAGLGRSIAGAHTPGAVRSALAAIAADAAPARPGDAAIVQHQVDARALAVIAREGRWPAVIELFPPDHEAMSRGTPSRAAAPLDEWDDPAAPALLALLPAIDAAIEGGVGVDVEVAIDREGRPWVVQARPLTRSLEPGFPAFLAALVDAGDPLPGGRWALDAEHNPAPLSPAHAWLIGHIACRRPGRARDRVLAGWLYTPKGTPPPPPPADALTSPPAALALLQGALLPAARGRLAALDARLTDADPPRLLDAFTAADEGLLAVFDDYARLAPARRRAAPTLPPAATPRCLVDRRRFADVLPTAWDIASPTLAELEPALADPTDAPAPAPLPADEADAALLLGELDDHLFALGLAPWRRLYLRAAALLGIDRADIFALTPPELRRALLRGAAPPGLIAARQAEARHRASLRPPLALRDGAPIPAVPHDRLAGHGIGLAPVVGPVAHRRDLAELLARPPPAASIVVLPTLTAHAALVLERLHVAAVVTTHGGALGHGALIARELGLTALLGCPGSQGLADGARVRVDPRAGRLIV